MKAIFIIGCGDIGRRVARLWQAQGEPVTALARSEASANALRRLAIAPVRGDLDRPESLVQLPVDSALVYYFAPPPEKGVTDPRVHAFVAALTAAPAPPSRVVYISTSGVYGDRGGDWVDENTPPAPQTDRARRRLNAETALRAWGRERSVPVVILRVGGIYGAGRLPLDRLHRALPVVREEESPYTNRIHADDLARVCLAAGERGEADAVYNVSDGQNGTMTEYFYAVADRLGLPRPPAVTLSQAREVMSPAMLSYLTESRRLDNRRMREELGIELLYPNLERGLEQAVTEEREGNIAPPVT